MEIVEEDQVIVTLETFTSKINKAKFRYTELGGFIIDLPEISSFIPDPDNNDVIRQICK